MVAYPYRTGAERKNKDWSPYFRSPALFFRFPDEFLEAKEEAEAER